jgi:hypothetical protein
MKWELDLQIFGTGVNSFQIAVPGRLNLEMLLAHSIAGLVKQEQLRHNLAGFWFSRLSYKNRVICGFD